MTEVSVIMPAYNAEKHIREAIQSVVNQTYKEWELLVIDDCSMDATASIVKKEAARDSRIHYFKNRVNLGVSESRNRGVRKASGRWIAFLDSDDIWKVDKLEKQMALSGRYLNVRFIYTGSGFISENGKESTYILRVPEQISYRMLLKQNLISCSSVLIRKELIEQYPMRNDAIHEDYAAWLQILRSGEIAYAVDEPLLIYRLSAQSNSSDKKRAAKMTWDVYQAVGLSTLEKCYYFCWYTVKNLLKYRGIKAGFGNIKGKLY